MMKIHLKLGLWPAVLVVAMAAQMGVAQAQMRFGGHQGANTAQIKQRIEARMAERREAFINELGLSREQRQQWDLLTQRRTALGESQRTQQSAFRARLDAELDSATDLKRLHQEFTLAQDAQIALRRQLQRDFLALYESLNATQQSKLRGQLQMMLDQAPSLRSRFQGR
jgi:hypothetical protein